MATKELTYGNPFKLILGFSLPIFFGNLFQQFYNLVDALIVGRTIGIKALGAVGACAPLIFLVISFIFAATQGFTVVTAQKFGNRDYKLLKKSVAISFILSFILMVILTLVSAPFSFKMLSFLRTPEDIINPANEYIFIMFIGIFATVFYNLSSNIIRALGDSKTPLYFLIFASFLNIILDLLFILKFNMGIKGAAWATVVSQGISTILCISFMFIKFPLLRLTKKDWIVEKEFIYEHIRIGIPMGFQMSVLSIGIIALQYVLNGLGSIAVTGYTTAMRIDQMFSQIYLALGATMATYSAQNYGANKLSRIKEGAKASVAIALFASIFTIIILGFFAKPITHLFMDKIDEQVTHYAVFYLHVIMIFFIFLGILMIYRNILQGMGNVVVPLASSITELAARTICAFALGYYFKYTGICFATPAAWLLGALVLYIGYKLSLVNNFKKLKNIPK